MEVSGLEPPTSTLRTCLGRISADSGEPSWQVSELSTRLRIVVNGSVRGMVAGRDLRLCPLIGAPIGSNWRNISATLVSVDGEHGDRHT